MYNIDGTNLTFVRGDTVTYSLSLYGINGLPLNIINNTYTVYFTIRENYESSNYIFQTSSTSIPWDITIPSNYTKIMKPGEYVYDIEVVIEKSETETLIDTCVVGTIKVLPDVKKD